MDRWSLVATLNYLSHDAEAAIVLSKTPHYNNDKGRKIDQPDGHGGRPDACGLHERRLSHGDEPGPSSPGPKTPDFPRLSVMPSA